MNLICSISAACSAGGWLVYKGMILSSMWHWMPLDSFMQPYNYFLYYHRPPKFFYTLPHPVLAAPYLLSRGLSFSRIASKWFHIKHAFFLWYLASVIYCKNFEICPLYPLSNTFLYMAEQYSWCVNASSLFNHFPLTSGVGYLWILLM